MKKKKNYKKIQYFTIGGFCLPSCPYNQLIYKKMIVMVGSIGCCRCKFYKDKNKKTVKCSYENEQI